MTRSRWRLLAFLCDEACGGKRVRRALHRITRIEERLSRDRRLELRRRREALGQRHLQVASRILVNQGVVKLLHISLSSYEHTANATEAHTQML